MPKQVVEIPDVIDEALAVSELSEEIKTVGGFPVPEGTQRVRVRDEKGKLAWRKIAEVKSTDVIDLTAKGQPQWMEGTLGRPRTESHPTLHEQLPPDSPLVADLIRIKEASMRTDPIVLTVESTPESPAVLDQVMAGISEEAASLRHERMEAERNGRDSSSFSMRRVVALKAIGDTYLKRKEVIQNTLIDLDGQAFQKVFGLISETFARAMNEAGVREELADSVFAKFRNMFDDEWRVEAKSRMKGEEE